MLENIIATEELWLIVGLGLLALDVLLINSYVLMWFGVGALVTGAAKMLYPELETGESIVLMAVVSLGTLLLWIKVFKPRQGQPPSPAVLNKLIGVRGLISRYNPATRQGQMRLQAPVGGHDIWDIEVPEAGKMGATVEIEKLDVDGKIIVKVINT